MTLEQVKDEALHFSPKERAELAHLLLVSLDPPPVDDLDAIWDDEISRRVCEIENGKAKGRPAFAVINDIRAARK